jgi:hypothetical protein
MLAILQGVKGCEVCEVLTGGSCSAAVSRRVCYVSVTLPDVEVRICDGPLRVSVGSLVRGWEKAAAGPAGS